MTVINSPKVIYTKIDAFISFNELNYLQQLAR